MRPLSYAAFNSAGIAFEIADSREQVLRQVLGEDLDLALYESYWTGWEEKGFTIRECVVKPKRKAWWRNFTKAWK